MKFAVAFTKVALKLPDEVTVRATPKKYGGSNPKARYLLRYDGEKKRWSCSCPDWTVRRSWLPKDMKKHWDCKHIRAHKADKKPWDVKDSMPKLTSQLLDRLKKDGE